MAVKQILNHSIILDVAKWQSLCHDGAVNSHLLSHWCKIVSSRPRFADSIYATGINADTMTKLSI